MNRQQHWRTEYRQRHPRWESGQALYRRLLDDRVVSTTRILDIGCGSTDFMRDVYGRTPHTYGIDPDPLALAENRTIAHTTVADALELPFDDDLFDIVTLMWVVEHLEHPARVFREAYRVLRPGGVVVFLTPNTWNYNAWLIRAVPNRLHDAFTRRLYGRRPDRAYPTFYRMNSPRRVERLLTETGFQREQLIFNGDPTYIAFNRPLFVLACAIERLLDLPGLRRARVHIIAVYRKR